MLLIRGREWEIEIVWGMYAAKSLQSCPTLCDPIDSSPLGSSVPGVLQARILEWVAISFSNAWKWKVKVKLLSRAWLLATPWTAAYQAPPSMGFSRQEYWSGYHCLLDGRYSSLPSGVTSSPLAVAVVCDIRCLLIGQTTEKRRNIALSGPVRACLLAE